MTFLRIVYVDRVNKCIVQQDMELQNVLTFHLFMGYCHNEEIPWFSSLTEAKCFAVLREM